MQISLKEFLTLRDHLPMVDVRSHGEYASGHIPGAENEPLLTDEERVVVGTAYKTTGQHEAIKEGFRLVGPRLSAIISRTEHIARGSEILIHCWRGGMRSVNFSQFVGMAGIQSRVLDGGYKTYRQAALEAFKNPLPLITLTGCTGSGKSDVLRELERQGEQVLDLEAIAHHKGSAFGGLLQLPQPTTEQFQNNVFEKLLKFDLSRRIWVEDESIAIGKIFLPTELWSQMNKGPLVQLDVNKEIRVKRLVEEYGPADREEFLQIMAKITKKLGGQNFNAARERLLQNDMFSVIEILLTYYDKAYLGSIHKRQGQIKSTIPWNGEDLSGFVKHLSSTGVTL